MFHLNSFSVCTLPHHDEEVKLKKNEENGLLKDKNERKNPNIFTLFHFYYDE